MKLIKDYINKRVLNEIYELSTLTCEKLISKDFVVPNNAVKASMLYDELREQLIEFDKTATALDELMLCDEKCEEYGV